MQHQCLSENYVELLLDRSFISQRCWVTVIVSSLLAKPRGFYLRLPSAHDIEQVMRMFDQLRVFSTKFVSYFCYIDYQVPRLEFYSQEQPKIDPIMIMFAHDILILGSI